MADQPVQTSRRVPVWWSTLRTIARVFRTGIGHISVLFSWIAGTLVLVLMLMVVVEVVLRKYFQSTLGGTVEVSEVLLVILVFLGISYTQRTGGHVATDLLTTRVPLAVARVMRFIGLLVAVAVLLWAAQASAVRGWNSMKAGEARFGIREVPVWPARLVVPVGFFLAAMETLFAAIDTLGKNWRPATLSGVRSNDPTAATEDLTKEPMDNVLAPKGD